MLESLSAFWAEYGTLLLEGILNWFTVSYAVKKCN